VIIPNDIAGFAGSAGAGVGAAGVGAGAGAGFEQPVNSENTITSASNNTKPFLNMRFPP